VPLSDLDHVPMLVVICNELELVLHATRYASPRPSTLADGVGRVAFAAHTASSNAVQHVDSSSQPSVVPVNTPSPWACASVIAASVVGDVTGRVVGVANAVAEVQVAVTPGSFCHSF
jgi:hypothetical protein